jgi:hypothetical protein
MSVKDNMSIFSDLANDSVERMTALSELNMQVAERAANRQIDLMTRFMEQGTRFMRSATEARGYNDLYQAQVDMAKEASEQMMAESKTTMQLANEARDQYRAWYEGTLSMWSKRSGAGDAASA